MAHLYFKTSFRAQASQKIMNNDRIETLQRKIEI